MSGIFKLFKLLFWWAVVLLVVLLVVSFALKNQGSVDIHYYFGFARTVPLWSVPVAGIAAGILVGAITTMIWVVRSKRQLALERRKTRKLDRQLSDLKAPPARVEG